MGVPGKSRAVASIFAILARESDQIGRPIHRLDRANTQTRQCSPIENRGNQILKPRHRRQFPSPPAEVDARKDQLLTACGNKRFHRPQTLAQADGPAWAASDGNDAKRASIPTAVLNLEVRARLARVGGKWQRSQIGVSKI